MSQNKFVSLPVLQLNPSKTLRLLIMGLHLIALISITYSIYIHITVNIFLGLLISLSFYYYLQYYKNLLSLKMIKCRQDGMWILGYEKSTGELKPLLASLKSEYMITDWLIVLRFKIGSTKIKSIPIFKDMLTSEKFKRLKIVLPYLFNIKNQ